MQGAEGILIWHQIVICIFNTGTNILLIQNGSASQYVHVHRLSYFTAHEPCVAVLPSTYLMLYYTAATPPPPPPDDDYDYDDDHYYLLVSMFLMHN